MFIYEVRWTYEHFDVWLHTGFQCGFQPWYYTRENHYAGSTSQKNCSKSVYAVHNHFIGYITQFTEQISPREATSSAPSQEIPLILWNHKIQYFSYQIPPPVSLSLACWIRSTPSHLVSARSRLILSSHLRLGLPVGSFLQNPPHLSPKKPLYFSPLYVLNSQPISNLPSFNHPNNICWGAKVSSFLIMQSYPPLSCLKGCTNLPNISKPFQNSGAIKITWRNFHTENKQILYAPLCYSPQCRRSRDLLHSFPLNPKYLPQHPIRGHPQTMFLP
jgi:hypothetical protein